MAITSFPFENGDTNESQFSRLFVELQDSGVAASEGSTAFKVTANGSDLVLSIAAGFALVRGHAVDSTATEAVTLAAAESNPRIDRIVLRLDPIANSITVVVLKGTAAVSPTAPALTQTTTGNYELLLADVTVKAATLAIAQADVTDKRTFVGGRVGVWTTPTRPTTPRKGQLGYNASLPDFEFWDGATWKLVVDPSRFLAANGKAVDSDKLDGFDSSHFLSTTGKAADANLLDGIDSPTFARRDQANSFAGTVNVTSGQLQEGGQRVYSPNNPPPRSGAVIVQTIRGAANVQPKNNVASTHPDYEDFTIPAVNMAKAQVRHLGGGEFAMDSNIYIARAQLVNNTTLRVYTHLYYSNTSYIYNMLGTTKPFQYEITEWS